MSRRYIVTRMKKDPSVPARYRRSGWMAFDTKHEAHDQVWNTKAGAILDAERLNRVHEQEVVPRRCPQVTGDGTQCDQEAGHDGPCGSRDVIDDETGQVLR